MKLSKYFVPTLKEVPNDAVVTSLFLIKNRDYVLAPTHEEIMTYHARNVVKSYKDMPQIWYQIQTKFRNEPRPRSGVIRGRQFLMKDSYSFDTSWEAFDKSRRHRPVQRQRLQPGNNGLQDAQHRPHRAMGGTGS